VSLPIPPCGSHAISFEEASKRLGDELKRFDKHRARLKEAGFGDATAAAVSSKGNPTIDEVLPGDTRQGGVGVWERVRASGQLFSILRTIMPRIGHNTDI
jgi:hypothetical protein